LPTKIKRLGHPLREMGNVNFLIGIPPWWLVSNSPLGTPRGRYDEHSSKSSLSYETKVYRTSRRKPNFRRWCLLASRWYVSNVSNFWWSMLVLTPFALCFVTLRGIFMHFPELTY
jgi:hypothetical protein